MFEDRVNVVERVHAEERLRILGRPDVACDAAPAHDAEAIREVEVPRRMSHDEDGMAPHCRELAKQLHHLGLEPWVEACGRLVQEQQRGTAEQLGREPDALALPAGERADSGARVLLQSGAFDGSRNRSIDVVLRHVWRQSKSCRVSEGFEHGQARVDDLVLREVPEVGDARLDSLSVHENPSLRWRGDTGKDTKQRRLPGAALADDRHELSRLDAERHRLQDHLVAHGNGDVVRVEPEDATIITLDERRSVEDQPKRPHAYLGSGAQRCALDEQSIEARSVPRTEIAKLETHRGGHDLGMEA